MYKFTVLMSVYKNDDPKYLDEAINSIYCEQTRKPSQVVIIKDGPLNSELEDVLLKYTLSYKDIFDVVALEKNMGLGFALQSGYSYCKHEIIARMDSDDISDGYRFEKQIGYMETNLYIDVLGTSIKEFKKSIDEEMRIRDVPLKLDGIKKMLKRRNPMNHVTVCMKKSALEACGGYESLDLLEDYYLWIKMLAKDIVLENMPEPLVYVRLGSNFSKKRGAKSRIEGWKQLQEKLLEYKMITIREAIINMITIRLFIYMPTGFRELIYNKMLRK